METEARYTLVGAIVVITTIIAVTSVLWLTKTGGGTAYNHYDIYFVKQSLSGLQENSIVTMKGIQVGAVEGLNISGEDIERVKVRIRVERKTPVKQDNQAVIVRNLLTGFASIDLVGGTQASEALTLVPPDEDYPIIKEGSSKLEQVADSIPDLLKQVSSTVSRVELLLSDTNLQHVEKTLSSVEHFSTNLAASDQELTALITNLNDTMKDVRGVTKSIKEIVNSSGGNFAESVEQLNAFIADARVLTKSMDTNLNALTKQLNGSLNVATQGVEEMALGVTQASHSMTSAAEALKDLKATVFGPQRSAAGPGE